MHDVQDGVEVPPEEEEFPIEEEVDLALLETHEAEDLSYAAMFANTLNIGKESLETPQKAQDGLQWSSDPIVPASKHRPGALQAPGHRLCAPGHRTCNASTSTLSYLALMMGPWGGRHMCESSLRSYEQHSHCSRHMC